jgi:signal transduction histidine kinase
MASSLEGVEQRRQELISDLTHELRTPLTILRGEIQVALREPGNHPLLIDTLKSSLDESLHLSRLIDSLLTLARADAGTGLGKRAQVDPADPVRRVLERLRPIADERGVTLKFTGADEGTRPGLFADPAALERILLNLAENAVKHSPAGNPVEVILSVDAGEVRFQVVDRGIGIAPEHLPRIFDRFYRIDAARRRMDGGAGLGLAIVKTLVEAHGVPQPGAWAHHERGSTYEAFLLQQNLGKTPKEFGYLPDARLLRLLQYPRGWTKLLPYQISLTCDRSVLT